VPRSKSIVGSNWGFMEGRSNLDCNSTLLLDANGAVRVSHADIEAQFEPQHVGEGSAFSFGGGGDCRLFPDACDVSQFCWNCIDSQRFCICI